MVENINSTPLLSSVPAPSTADFAPAEPVWQPDLPVPDMLVQVTTTYRDRFYGLAASLHRPPDSPDDLIQNGLEAVLRRSQNPNLPPLRFTTERQLVAYLGRAITNSAIGHNRRIMTPTFDPTVGRFDMATPDGQAALGLFELVESLAGVVKNAGQLNLYVLQNGYGLTSGDLADLTGRSTAAIETHVRRARKKLEEARTAGLLEDLRPPELSTL